jgi:hypothetical protein
MVDAHRNHMSEFLGPEVLQFKLARQIRGNAGVHGSSCSAIAAMQ